MKWKLWLCTLAAVGAMVTAAAAGTYRAAGEDPAAAERYLLRSCRDYVAVYTLANPAEPLSVTEIPVQSLPAADRAKLENGILVGSREELLLLLEDLGS